MMKRNFLAALALLGSSVSAWADGPELFCATSDAFYPDVPACATPWMHRPTGSRARRQTQDAGASARAAREQQLQRQAEKEQAEREAAEDEAAAAAASAARKAETARQRGLAAEKTAAHKAAVEQATARAERLAAREAEDTALGYKHTTVTDFILDYREMPSGAKVVLEGLHYALGPIESLSQGQMSTQPIYLETAAIPRDMRKSMMECHLRFPYCGVTVWAHVGCASTMGRIGAPCLVVDQLSGGRYGEQTAKPPAAP